MAVSTREQLEELRDRVFPEPAGPRHRKPRDLLNVAGSRFSFTWPGVVVFIPVFVAVVALEAPTGFTAVQLALVGLITTTGIFFASLVYHLASRSYRGQRSVPFVGLLAYWISVGAVLGLVRAGLVWVWTSSPTQLPLRLTGSLLSGLIWVPAISVLQALLVEGRADLRRLWRAEAELRSRHLRAVFDLREQGEALLQATQAAVEPYLDRLLVQVAGLRGSPAHDELERLALAIRHVSDDVVRTTSHRVAATSVLSPQVVRPQIWRRIVRHVSVRPICAPWIVAVMLLLSAGADVVRLRGMAVAVVIGACTCGFTAVLSLVQRLTTSWSPCASGLTQWGALLAVVGLVAAALHRSGLYWLSWTGADIGASAALTFVPLCLAGTVLSSAWVAIREETAALSRALRHRNSALAATGAQVLTEAEELSRRVAAVLHGPVQGNLSTAAMLLTLYVHGEASRVQGDVVDDVRRLIQKAASELSRLSMHAAEPVACSQALKTLREQWAGVIDVAFSVDPAMDEVETAVQLLANDVLVDMVSNASRHGRARAVSICVSVGEHGVVLECTDDGSGLTDLLLPGLLCRSVDARGGQWTLERLSTGVRSRVSLPVPQLELSGLRSGSLFQTLESTKSTSFIE